MIFLLLLLLLLPLGLAFSVSRSPCLCFLLLLLLPPLLLPLALASRLLLPPLAAALASARLRCCSCLCVGPGPGEDFFPLMHAAMEIFAKIGASRKRKLVNRLSREEEEEGEVAPGGQMESQPGQSSQVGPSSTCPWWAKEPSPVLVSSSDSDCNL